MKRFLAVSGLISMVVVQIFAGGYEGPGIGIPALSMGGAFIGKADDWTAIYWNPAGLTQLEGKGVGISLDYPTIEQYDSNSVANPFILNQNMDQADYFFQGLSASEASNFNKKKMKGSSLLPAIGGWVKINDKSSLALGSYMPIVNGSNWRDTSVSGINYAEFRMAASALMYNISFAHILANNFSLGVGLNYVRADDDIHAKKQTDNYLFEFHTNNHGDAYQGLLGLIYKLDSLKLQMGAVYRTGTRVKMDGYTELKYPHPLIPVLLMLAEGSKVETKPLLPASYGIGFLYRLKEEWSVTLDWQGSDWSKNRQIKKYENQGVFLSNINRTLDNVDTNMLRLGTEYKLDRWAFRGGFFTSPGAYPDKALSLSNFVDVNLLDYTFGVGYNWDNFGVDVGYIYGNGDETINGVKYEKTINSLQLAMNYRF